VPPTSQSDLHRYTSACLAYIILSVDKLKVFICDDSATVRERLVIMALDLPAVNLVGQADDAPGCMDAIRKARPDVVILDIRMPGGNGMDVLRQLKEENPAPKVIMLTNFAYAQYRRRCEEAGADFFLDKSTEFDQIPLALEQVRQGLRPYPAQHEMQRTKEGLT
jgi:DNA-binding NarL/FixJ family response regulator